MLRITTQETTEALTFLVEGKLVGEWAKELERSWKRVIAEPGHRATVVDLSDTLFIDEEGRRVLAKLFHEGASFRTACPMTESIVSEITGKTRTQKSPDRVLRAILLLLIPFAIGARTAHAQCAPLQRALKQNPQVQVANLNTAVNQENQMVARSALLEQANLAVSEGRENLPLSGAGAQEPTVHEQNVQLVVSQCLGTLRADLAHATGQMESLYTK
jgi:hypothetical protein